MRKEEFNTCWIYWRQGLSKWISEQKQQGEKDVINCQGLIRATRDKKMLCRTMKDIAHKEKKQKRKQILVKRK